jgi:hypothetical protein
MNEAHTDTQRQKNYRTVGELQIPQKNEADHTRHNVTNFPEFSIASWKPQDEEAMHPDATSQQKFPYLVYMFI